MDRRRRKQQRAEAVRAIETYLEGREGPGGAFSESELESLLESLGHMTPELDLTRTWLEAMISTLSKGRPELVACERTDEEWSRIFAPYPTHEDGRVVCFEADDVAGFTEALERFGVVVIRVFDAQRCARTVEAMFEEINATALAAGRGAGIAPEDPSTWEDTRWPSTKRFLLDRPAFHAQAFANRFDERIHDVFAALWGDRRLRVSVDNWGVTRGSRDIPGVDDRGESVLEDRPRWGRPLSVHWDYNPWLFDRERKAGRQQGWQALVALNDHDEENGCHLTLPGGERFVETWCEENAYPSSLGMKRRGHRPGEEDPMRRYMQRIPLERGQMVLWSWGQLHGNTVNRSRRMRLVQFIRMFPAAEVDPFYETHDRYAPSRILSRYPEALGGLELSERERKLLGLEQW